MKKGQEPFHPAVHQNSDGTYDIALYKGMSTRLYLAGMAMQGLLSNTNVNMILSGNNGMQVPNLIAEYALQMTDALIKMEEETR